MVVLLREEQSLDPKAETRGSCWSNNFRISAEKASKEFKIGDPASHSEWAYSPAFPLKQLTTQANLYLSAEQALGC